MSSYKTRLRAFYVVDAHMDALIRESTWPCACGYSQVSVLPGLFQALYICVSNMLVITLPGNVPPSVVDQNKRLMHHNFDTSDRNLCKSNEAADNIYTTGSFFTPFWVFESVSIVEDDLPLWGHFVDLLLSQIVKAFQGLQGGQPRWFIDDFNTLQHANVDVRVAIKHTWAHPPAITANCTCIQAVLISLPGYKIWGILLRLLTLIVCSLPYFNAIKLRVSSVWSTLAWFQSSWLKSGKFFENFP